MGRVAVGRIHTGSIADRVEGDLLGNGMGVGEGIALAWELGQHDIGLELAEHGGETPDHTLGHQQHTVAHRSVMGHRTSGLVEDIRGMCADG
jgi:hypothetical protein